jgi:hypothetical protein
MMKRMSLLLGMVTVVSLSAAIEVKKNALDDVLQSASRVYCDAQTVFQLSTAGQTLAQWSDAKNKELNDFAGKKQAELKKKEQEIMASNVTPDQIPLKKLELEHLQRQAALDIERMKTQLEAELSNKMKTAEADIKKTISSVASEKGWLEVVNKSEATALFFSPKLDATSTILEAFNKDTRAAAAKEILRTDSQEKTAALLKA